VFTRTFNAPAVSLATASPVHRSTAQEVATMPFV